MATKKLNVFIFNWKSGGYNTVRAKTRSEAVSEIKSGKQWRGDATFQNACGGIDWKTLRRATQKKLDALDKHYAGMFD